MITKEEIIDILKMYSGYVDRSRSDMAVHEDNFNAVAYEIEIKLHQHNVISAVCVHPFKYIMKEENGMFKCIHCGKELDEQTVL